MNEDDVDRINRNRRHFLTVATITTGVVGAGLATFPFLASLKPSARAQALGAPVEVAIGSLQPGEMIRVLWRGKLVFVLRRTHGGRLHAGPLCQPRYRVQRHVVGMLEHVGGDRLELRR
jgi:Rieske Fe-S protein